MCVSVTMILSPSFAAGSPMMTLLSCPHIKLIEIDHTALDLHDGRAAVHLDTRRPLDFRLCGGLHGDIALRSQLHIALRLYLRVALHRDGELILLTVEYQLIALTIFYRDTSATVVVVQRNHVTGARANDALLYRAADDILRNRVLAIPQATQHIWIIDIAHLEADEHFVVDLRQKFDAALRARAGSYHPRPVAAVLLGQPGVFHFDAPLVLRVFVVGDNADNQPALRLHLLFGREEREERTWLMAGDGEARHVALLSAVCMNGTGDKVDAAEALAHLVDLYGNPGDQRRRPLAKALRLDKASGHLTGYGLCQRLSYALLAHWTIGHQCLPAHVKCFAHLSRAFAVANIGRVPLLFFRLPLHRLLP